MMTIFRNGMLLLPQSHTQVSKGAQNQGQLARKKWHVSLFPDSLALD
jgi:hypothetical protein